MVTIINKIWKGGGGNLNLDIQVLEQYTAHLACAFVCEENWNP